MPVLTIACHPDLRRVGDRALLGALGAGESVTLSRVEMVFAPPGQTEGAPLGDVYLSRSPVAIEPRETGVTVVHGGAGSVVVDGVRVTDRYPLSYVELERGVLIELSRRVLLMLHMMSADEPAPTLDLVGASDAIEYVRRAVTRVADIEVPVLIRGETGAGKERVAQAIHTTSPRAAAPFVAINMAAVSPTTAVAELFGHTRGAFTGATEARAGLFERAHLGTLFLDEIGATPDHIQAMLLRVLECGEVLPLGGREPRQVDVRLVAATDADLDVACERGAFRSALLHRLAGYEVLVPPLRDRLDDIPRLAVAFLRQELETAGELHRLTESAADARPWFPPELMGRLIRLPWPGNVRQLRNVIRQLVISSRSEPVVRIDESVERLLRAPRSSTTPPAKPRTPDAVTPPVRRRPGDVTDDELVNALRANRWAILPTASALGVPRSSLYDLIERCPSIRKASDVPRDELESCLAACAGDLTEMSAALQVSRRGLQLRLRELGLSS